MIYLNVLIKTSAMLPLLLWICALGLPVNDFVLSATRSQVYPIPCSVAFEMFSTVSMLINQSFFTEITSSWWVVLHALVVVSLCAMFYRLNMRNDTTNALFPIRCPRWVHSAVVSDGTICVLAEANLDNGVESPWKAIIWQKRTLSSCGRCNIVAGSEVAQNANIFCFAWLPITLQSCIYLSNSSDGPKWPNCQKPGKKVEKYQLHD